MLRPEIEIGLLPLNGEMKTGTCYIYQAKRYGRLRWCYTNPLDATQRFLLPSALVFYVEKHEKFSQEIISIIRENIRKDFNFRHRYFLVDGRTFQAIHHQRIIEACVATYREIENRYYNDKRRKKNFSTVASDIIKMANHGEQKKIEQVFSLIKRMRNSWHDKKEFDLEAAVTLIWVAVQDRQAVTGVGQIYSAVSKNI